MHPTVALFRRNAWATERLLRWCSWQQPEVVGTSAPDVYGSIEGMFNHILGAETRYLKLLTGAMPEDPVNERRPRPLEELLEPAAALAARWEAILGEGRDVEELRTHDRADGRSEMPDWLPLLQAVHHGDDHRAQIGTQLGRARVIGPESDGWFFGWEPTGGSAEAPAWADVLLRRAVEHHLWATEQLLDSCRRLGGDQLELTAPGTYGGLLATLRHLVEADRGYLSRLRRAGPAAELTAAGLADLAQVWDGQRQAWRQYLHAAPDLEATVECRDGWYAGWVLVLQAVHHGNDHRAHAGTVLLHHALEAPEIDVWAYAVAEGLLREIA